MRKPTLSEFYAKQVPYPLIDKHRYVGATHKVGRDSGIVYTDVVYVLVRETDYLCKIGITRNLRARIMGIKNATGVSCLHLISITLSDCDESYKVVEAELHKYFKDKRAFGEWFSLSVKDVLMIRELFWNVIGGEDVEDDIKDVFKHLKLKHKYD